MTDTEVLDYIEDLYSTPHLHSNVWKEFMHMVAERGFRKAAEVHSRGAVLKHLTSAKGGSMNNQTVARRLVKVAKALEADVAPRNEYEDALLMALMQATGMKCQIVDTFNDKVEVGFYSPKRDILIGIVHFRPHSGGWEFAGTTGVGFEKLKRLEVHAKLPDDYSSTYRGN